MASENRRRNLGVTSETVIECQKSLHASAAFDTDFPLDRRNNFEILLQKANLIFEGSSVEPTAFSVLRDAVIHKYDGVARGEKVRERQSPAYCGRPISQ